MGVAFSTVVGRPGNETGETTLVLFRTVETVPFIIGFSIFYLSPYR